MQGLVLALDQVPGGVSPANAGNVATRLAPSPALSDHPRLAGSTENSTACGHAQPLIENGMTIAPDLAAKLRARRRAGPKTRAPLDSRNAAIWAYLRALGTAPFTVQSITAATEIRERTVSAYVTALHRAGVIRCIDPPAMTQMGATSAVYRAARQLGPVPPLIRYSERGRPASDPNSP